MFIIDYPLKFMLETTIPPTDEENYSHKLLTLWPLFGGIFIYLNFKELIDSKKQILLIFIPLLFLLEAIFIFKRPVLDKTPPRYFWIVPILALFSGLIWNKLCSDLLLTFLQTTGFIFAIPNNYLGNVFLSVGNSLPDGLTTIALAKKG